MDLKSLSTAALISLYNEKSGKSIKKFSSRAAGEKQVTALLAKAPSAPAAPARKVKGAAGAANAGRPKGSFIVKLTRDKAKSSPQKDSLRGQLIEWLDGLTNKSATIEAIEKKFDRNMRGVVNKLIETKWLETTVQS